MTDVIHVKNVTNIVCMPYIMPYTYITNVTDVVGMLNAFRFAIIRDTAGKLMLEL